MSEPPTAKPGDRPPQDKELDASREDRGGSRRELDNSQQTTRLASAEPQESRGASPALSRGAFAAAVVGVVLLSVSITDCLVPWRAAASRDLLGLLVTVPFVIGAIPGVVLLLRGRGRASAGLTMLGCALVTIALAALVFSLRFVSYAWAGGTGSVILGAILAVAGLLLILFPMRRVTVSRAMANGWSVCGAAILLMAFIVGALTLDHFWSLVIYPYNGYSWLGQFGRCTWRFFEAISPEAPQANACKYAQNIVRQLLAIGAATGIVLVVAGVIGRMSARRSANDQVR